MKRSRNTTRSKKSIIDKLMTFEEAIKDSKLCNKIHLLLGNGFSIAYDPTLFSYPSLFEKSNFTNHSEIKGAFDVLNTKDFEQVIGSLEESSKLTDRLWGGTDKQENDAPCR